LLNWARGGGGVGCENLQQHGPQEPFAPLRSPIGVQGLFDAEPARRIQAARSLFGDGAGRISNWLEHIREDEEFQNLMIHEQIERPDENEHPTPRLTVGIAVLPETFEKIRASNGSPILADAPSDQDVIEFELEFKGDDLQTARLDILTTKNLEGNGAIARFLQKFGEGIQQVEIDVTDVERATEILRTRFKVEPIYPATRPGANGTRVNFFLVTTSSEKKVLVELVEQRNTIPQ
jgi:methylmalonyl-CoA/ethylmalonyl-CoA epimerase